MKWFCLISAILAFFECASVEAQAESVMHQIYGALYGISGSIYMCTFFILKKIQGNKK